MERALIVSAARFKGQSPFQLENNVCSAPACGRSTWRVLRA